MERLRAKVAESTTPKGQTAKYEHVTNQASAAHGDDAASQLGLQDDNNLCSRCASFDYHELLLLRGEYESLQQQDDETSQREDNETSKQEDDETSQQEDDEESPQEQEESYRLRYKSERLMVLDGLGSETGATTCSLCLLFDAVKYMESSIGKENSYSLYLTIPPKPYPLKGGLVLRVVSTIDGDIQEQKVSLWTTDRWAKFIVFAKASELASRIQSLDIREVCASTIDFSVFRNWLQWCQGQHRECADLATGIQAPSDLKLIDCERRTIVPWLPRYKYSALSYVWGQSIYDRVNDDRLPEVLPQTMEDAFLVSKELGIRHIWIDRYCIDQRSEETKRVQIRQMGLIFERAALTIVAAAGADPHIGLPGVSIPRQNHQIIVRVGDTCLKSAQPNPVVLITGSVWNHRSWTYQEQYFSRRRLVFTQQEVYYECRAGYARESLNANHTVTPDINFDGLQIYDRNPRAVAKHLAHYTRRQLTYDTDAIRAFEGILNDFRRRKHPVYHYQGVPIMPPVLKASPQDLTENLEFSDATRSERFVVGLCWRHCGQGKRRIEFPTWSWAGWNVPLEFPMQEVDSGLRLTDRVEVFVEGLGGDHLSLDDDATLALIDLSPELLNGFIHVDALTIPLDIRYLFPKGLNSETWLSSFRDTGWPQNLSGSTAWFEDEELVVQIATYSLYTAYDDNVQEREPLSLHSDGVVLGIVFGACKVPVEVELGEGIFVMVVQDRGDHFVRIGHFDISPAMAIVKVKSTLEVYDLWNPEMPRGKGWEKLNSVTNGWDVCFRDKKRRTIRLG